MMKPLLQWTCLLMLLLTGCEEDAADPTNGAALPATAYSPPEPVVPTDLPTGWRNGPKSEVRSASYVLEGDSSTVADVSLVIRAGQPGGLLRSVNSWRAQLGQAALDQAGIEHDYQWLTTQVGEGIVIDISGLASGADPAFDGRMVAVVVEQPLQTWFFKMRGNAELVADQRNAFLDWVGSVGQAGAPDTPDPSIDNLVHFDSVIPPPPDRRPDWHMPDDWIDGPAQPGHHAAFTVRGPGGRTGTGLIVLTSGNGSGDLAKLNRWRHQAGLPPLARQDAASRIQSVFANGNAFSIVQLAGPKGSTIAAWTTRDEGTWVIKLSGPASVINSQRPNFATFLQSIRFPDN